MSRELGWDVARDVLRTVAEETSGEGEAEALLRRSRGSSARLVRGAPDDLASWTEEGVAIRVALPDGGAGHATAPSWSDAQDAARRACELAATSQASNASPPLHRARCPEVSRAVACDPSSPEEVREGLREMEIAALGADHHVAALDAASARSAVIDSYLVTSEGLALHQRHAACAAHATVLARDGMLVVARQDAWAGPRWDTEVARPFGERLGRAALVQLLGSGAAPPRYGALVLGEPAVAELTFAFAPALLGLSRGSETLARLELPTELGLVEDGYADVTARALPADGAGRALRRVGFIESGSWRAPPPGDLPLVRAGMADAPRAGWARLSWSWGTETIERDELVAAAGTGLLAQWLHPIHVDARMLTWRGSASGWWIEDGKPRHALSGVPIELSLPDVLTAIESATTLPLSLHPSGTLRTNAWLVRMPA